MSRPNRFVGLVQLSAEEEVKVHIADSGRLQELLYRGAKVYVSNAVNKNRSTAYDLRLVHHNGTFVSVDSRVPNKLIAEMLRTGSLTRFKEYSSIKSEPRVVNGRLDFLLSAQALRDCYLEIKSCTLVEKGIALFPDAPTARGSRHLQELINLKSKGFRAVIIFIVQRSDALIFSPNKSKDPNFGSTLETALKAGVEAYAYTCRINQNEIRPEKEIEVTLNLDFN